MTDPAGFQEHWLNIEPERMARYETMFQLASGDRGLLRRGRDRPGPGDRRLRQRPGHAAIELARRVGSTGHVHALDINAEFVRRARARAAALGLGDRITVHLLAEPALPLPDRALDRIVARNTIIYVPDPVAALSEFRRVLRPGGIAHAIEGDWRLTAVEPVPSADWNALIEAASWAWPWPEIGRGLYGQARLAGFDQVAVQVLTRPDTDGRLLGMIETVAGYARVALEPPASMP